MTDEPEVCLPCQAHVRCVISLFAMFRQDSRIAIPCSTAHESGKTFWVGCELWRRMLFVTHHRPFNPFSPVLSILKSIGMKNAHQVGRGVFCDTNVGRLAFLKYCSVENSRKICHSFSTLVSLPMESNLWTIRSMFRLGSCG